LVPEAGLGEPAGLLVVDCTTTCDLTCNWTCWITNM
jgi:hypothetical protein